MIGDGRKTYSDSTLEGFNKRELIGIIRTLEKNLRNAHRVLDVQTENYRILLEQHEKMIRGEVIDKMMKELENMR